MVDRKLVCIFGPGYCGRRIEAGFRLRGDATIAIGREAPADIATLLVRAACIVSTVPPEGDDDPVLALYGDALRASAARLVYLSSTGVYGDAAGGWVDEHAPLTGRRPARIAADRAWRDLGAAVLRLPGIYGPERSVVDRLRAGAAHRVDIPGQVFSRIHVDDVAAAVLACADQGMAGTFNIADDRPCAQAELVSWAAGRLGMAEPPLLSVADAGLSPAARAFYDENRRVANGKAKRLLGWRPIHPDYRSGLRALIASSSPSITSPAPASAVIDQR